MRCDWSKKILNYTKGYKNESLHLSDAHFKEDTYYADKIINAQVQALNSVGEFSACFIMFSGDLAFSGKVNEYRKACSYLRKLRSAIASKFQIDS